MRPPPPRGRRAGGSLTRLALLAASSLVLLALAAASALLLLFAPPAPAPAPAQLLRLRVRRPPLLRLRLASFNIRNEHNVTGVSGVWLDWRDRADAVAAAIRASAPAVVGVQEASRAQVDDLLARLPGFAAVAHGRRGRNASEAAAVLYDARALRLVAARTFWLSPTPGVVGSVAREWGALLPRVATVVTLRPRRRGGGAGAPAVGRSPFTVVNTHLDHDGRLARERGAEMVRDAALAAAAGGVAGAGAGEGVVEPLPALDPAYNDAPPAVGAPVFITGDLNSGPRERPAALISAGGFVDLLARFGGPGAAAPLRERDAPPPAEADLPVFSTFHNFSGVGVASVPRLDYIFASAGCGLRGAAWVDREARGGVWPSDHFAVVADVEYQCD